MARKYLALILFLMGLLQLLSWNDFVAALATYDLGSGAIVSVYAATFILGELFAAVLLLSSPSKGAIASFIVFVVWTFFGAQAFFRGVDVPNCGCFGRWLSQRLRWWVLLEDVYLLFLSWWVYRGVQPERQATSETLEAKKLF